MTNTVSTMILFGSTGDLSQRMLLPSLYGLDADGLLADDLRIVCTSRSEYDTDGFRDFAEKALDRFVASDRLNDDAKAKFLNKLFYATVDITDPTQFGKLADLCGPVEKGIAIYLSTAPSLFEGAIAGLKQAGLAGPTSRLALEKPLGQDLASSDHINDAVLKVFSEKQVYRIDHYLGKETVQNLLTLRFGNALFEPLWNSKGIDHVQISVAETVGLEGRIGYFDGSGSLRDMVQSHILQLVALVAMEPPAHMEANAVRDEKVKVFRALRPINNDTVFTHTVTGQYGAGVSGGKEVAGYIDELGQPSDTETFVAIKAHVDNWRWQGVPFYIRTGKRLPARRSEIVVQFKPVPHSIFSSSGGILQPNKLRIVLQPDETIQISMMVKEPGLDRNGAHMREVWLDLSLTDVFKDRKRRIAYERLMLDLIEGDATLFVRRDEVEAQWVWIDGIREGWKANSMKPKTYVSGTWGPSTAIALAERDGVTWYD
ncbi:glucose-6-phosphate 1-dehydrogenase [Zymomonas mobilis subsp. mobilis ZM4 = ATCC 31821]|uniref:Glucose-6-phosphate 1-dehydrogenase n=2 Tax=Zymomonas mobilis subsp. mobilis TaxID=120045 RepID=G6PD_ZYMMO|nr:glucose-6-phosphate dehydrogenase [Zymomonas mobilis]P21907.1 RecName: Full=Glucose-6-phosphate 1-dehydrogenase; Short=G6PD [Zymomonas mobilis subsp. mobilis ZM4 = ATCC 31821]AAA27692.1 glucose-6-phosphate dehydrogenase [Zymomonas mobilis subsp. mobilis str. CP4 = NRRL B-14023]AAG29865.1 glucose-6-phosphate 1-dehydrogenase [Zymomonas mobilis subsp. mobilis ZM4 = ATCC 31821]AAV88991.1 glucose-6-phosphate 1-dehydrogenase [Zymomonas mobilis subsp. mobilis ZM4 = ATCC 31821]ACV75419.1 glucose-6-